MIAAFFFKQEIMEPLVKQGVTVTTQVAVILIPLFILFEFAAIFIRRFFGETEDYKLNKLFSMILIWFLTFQFYNVMMTIDGLVEGIEGVIRENIFTVTPAELTNSFTAMPIEHLEIATKLSAKQIAITEVEKMVNEGKITQQEFQAIIKKSGVDEPTNWDPFEFLGKIYYALQNIPNILISSINAGLLFIARILIECLSLLLTSVLLILGPLAVAFNLMPAGINEGVLRQWFTAWLSIKCWGITLVVIEFINIKIMAQGVTNFTTSEALTLGQAASGPPLTTVLNLSILILVFMVPWLTSLYTKGTGGQFLSTAIAAGTTVVSMGSAAATGGASAAAKMGSKLASKMNNKSEE